VHRFLQEHQVFRIDHYLGKETVQNILVTRFANAIYEPIWNRNTIDHVQITVAETVGVGSRAKYYDTVGAVRDMFQNHILQLLALVAMEPPASFEAEALREEKMKVLRAIRPVCQKDASGCAVRGQYAGYREEPGVRKDSQTETFAAIRFFIDNWRWQGVPFYLRSGKRMATKASEITIQFKRPPHLMFPLPPGKEIASNLLSLCLQPDEGIHLLTQAKVPDTTADMHPVMLEFHYRDSFRQRPIPDAYERLLLDALNGDASLFNRGDHAELAWRLLDPIVRAWEEGRVPLAGYEPGSWGPQEADQLLERDGRVWHHGCAHS
jgi:glucose-6-phosphate 1-dehydrogenase